MNLHIVEISSNPIPVEEFLILETNGHSKLSDFCLLLKIKGEDSFKMIMTLPKIEPFSANDRLFIYTGKGEGKSVHNQKHGFDYSFYMQSKTSIWDQPNSEGVYLFDIENSASIKCN